MTEVTPRPWHYDAAEYEIRSNNSERHTIGRFHAGRHDDGNRAVPRKADAELIVKAVNAHDTLVAALDDLFGVGAWLIGAISKGIHVTNDALVLMEDELEKARAALEAAK